jgi:hypothetical protein
MWYIPLVESKEGEVMRTKPTYDWEWFESHSPFKKTLEKMCALEIEHELQRIPTVCGCYATNHHYKIKYNRALFERDFEKIKDLLLKTNVCKKNKDVFDFVNKLECDKRSMSELVLFGCGCMKYNSGSFEWDDMSGDQQ